MFSWRNSGPSIEECKERLTRARNMIGCFEALERLGVKSPTYLEVGCCFKEDEGLSTYVAAKFLKERLGGGQVYSIEADPDHVVASKQIIKGYQPKLLQMIEWVPGLSDQVLPGVLDTVDRVDFAFLDGGAHPATNLFEFLLVWEKLSPLGLILVDDCTFLKSTPAYSGRRDFGKAQLILPFLLLVEHINYTRRATSESQRIPEGDPRLDQAIEALVHTTPLLAELFKNKRVTAICDGLRDLQFAFCGKTQLVAARKPVLDELLGGKELNRIQFS